MGPSSVLVRDGVAHEDILAAYGIREGGCGAAHGGRVILSGVAPSERTQQVVEHDGRTGQKRTYTRQAEDPIVIPIDERGKTQTIVVPPQFGTETDCRAWLGADGSFSLALFDIVHHDGKAFASKSDGLGWFAGRTVLGAPGGPRFCFASCNRTEAKQTHPATADLLAALDFQGGTTTEWTALNDWVAGARAGRAVRMKLGGAIETVDGIPDSTMLNGSLDLAFTAAGDLVIGLDYRFHGYVVWPSGKTALSPVRQLGQGEVLAKASPTVLVVGLTTPVPESNTYAVVLGKPIGLGTGGSTYGFRGLRRGKQAHGARFARAKQVLGTGQHVGANEAVVDLTCGSYVRSPVGWEGERIHDWTPPKLPPLSPRAVTRASQWLPLSKVSALPGDTDLLLGISQGQLYAAWLPPPLPLPPGTSRFSSSPPPPLPPATPRPGSGWSLVAAVDGVAGDDGIADPGGDTAIAPGSWQAGGAAVITVEGQAVVLTKRGAVTLPPNTRAMAISQADAFQLFGAQGAKLVECRDQCRLLDPGLKGTISSVVPRTATHIALGYEDGRVGAYQLPASGGTPVAQHPIVAKLNTLLTQKPKP